jgi:hypothetical protein
VLLKRFLVVLPLAVLASAGALAADICEPGRPARVEDMSIVQLEHAFWACDHMASAKGVSATPASFCAVVTAELKKQKFGGDYEGLLDWWRLNKVAEYEKLERAEPPLKR